VGRVVSSSRAGWGLRKREGREAIQEEDESSVSVGARCCCWRAFA
jgi:hypothetical protein